jgi:hypothetical protein
MTESRDLQKRMISFGLDLENLLIDLNCAADDILAKRVHVTRATATATIERAVRAAAQPENLIRESLQVNADEVIGELLMQLIVSHKARLTGHVTHDTSEIGC